MSNFSDVELTHIANVLQDEVSHPFNLLFFEGRPKGRHAVVGPAIGDGGNEFGAGVAVFPAPIDKGLYGCAVARGTQLVKNFLRTAFFCLGIVGLMGIKKCQTQGQQCKS